MRPIPPATKYWASLSCFFFRTLLLLFIFEGLLCKAAESSPALLALDQVKTHRESFSRLSYDLGVLITTNCSLEDLDDNVLPALISLEDQIFDKTNPLEQRLITSLPLPATTNFFKFFQRRVWHDVEEVITEYISNTETQMINVSLGSEAYCYQRTNAIARLPSLVKEDNLDSQLFDFVIKTSLYLKDHPDNVTLFKEGKTTFIRVVSKNQPGTEFIIYLDPDKGHYPYEVIVKQNGIITKTTSSQGIRKLGDNCWLPRVICVKRFLEGQVLFSSRILVFFNYSLDFDAPPINYIEIMRLLGFPDSSSTN